jgi:hypothetical protein
LTGGRGGPGASASLAGRWLAGGRFWRCGSTSMSIRRRLRRVWDTEGSRRGDPGYRASVRRGRGAPSSDRRHVRHGLGVRLRLDGEDLGFDRHDRRLGAARLRTREVPQPWCHRRLRRRLTGTRAVDGARQPRAPASAPEETAIGPIVYEVVEPAADQIRVRLEPNDVQPISFDVVLSGVTPPVLRGAEPRSQPADEPCRRERDPVPPGRLGDRHDRRRRGDLRARGRECLRLPRPLLGRPAGRRRGAERPDRGYRRHSARPGRAPGNHEVDAIVLPPAGRLVLRDRHLPHRRGMELHLGVRQRAATAPRRP